MGVLLEKVVGVSDKGFGKGSEMVRDLTLAEVSSEEEKLDLENIKVGFQEAGFDCAIVPVSVDCDAKPYAEGLDCIAILETRILDMEVYVESLESRKKSLENTLKWCIEIKATEDKTSGLTNETKRRIAYEQLAEENEELQRLCGELRIFRREVSRLQIELENEQRAFKFLEFILKRM